MSDNDKMNEEKLSAVDKAIAAAKARKEARAAGTEAPAKAEKKPAAPKATDEEKAAAKAAKEADRAAKKAARDKERAEKLAARQADRSPAHMKKVQKAAERLSPLSQAAQLLFNEATHSLPQVDLAALANHFAHFNRVKATERALNQKLTVGMTVRVTGGDPRFLGKQGTIEKAQRIRCYVNVAGLNKPLYLFTSEVEPVTVTEETATTEETDEPAQATG